MKYCGTVSFSLRVLVICQPASTRSHLESLFSTVSTYDEWFLAAFPPPCCSPVHPNLGLGRVRTLPLSKLGQSHHHTFAYMLNQIYLPDQSTHCPCSSLQSFYHFTAVLFMFLSLFILWAVKAEMCLHVDTSEVLLIWFLALQWCPTLTNDRAQSVKITKIILTVSKAAIKANTYL